ncbi:hypothetical protein [Rubrolithibacter danxiaensis]|uniref:hypothetical protein n=1 Tax=Rubrolithibacter danxiaensis TaxID=3390805 RepID=UPI003BF898B1
MYKAIAASFYQFNYAWSGIEPIVQTFNKFQNNIRDIENSGLNQLQNNPAGYTDQRELQRKKLTEMAYSLSLKLKAFAKVKQNPVLEKAVDFSKSDFNKMKEEALVYTSQDILGLGFQHQAEAAAYQVSPQQLDELQTAINDFKPLTAQRDKVGDIRSVATKTLATLFKDARTNLGLLDTMVEGLSADKTFIGAYK